jgi:hypothetical protein
MKHILKTWPTYFNHMRDGVKNFEFRKMDRSFQPGDILELAEFSPLTGEFTGRKILRTISYILPGGSFGVPADYCVIGFLCPCPCTFIGIDMAKGKDWNAETKSSGE